MKLELLLKLLAEAPDTVKFDDVINVIDDAYEFTSVLFRNGELVNQAGQNSGSCKVFAFAKMHALNEQQVLHCFGDYYRVDVLAHADDDSHQNIRHFMKSGWRGISFDDFPLKPINK